MHWEVLTWARQNGCPDAAKDALEHAEYEYDDESDEVEYVMWDAEMEDDSVGRMRKTETA